MCFGAVVEHFNLLSRHLSGGAEKTMKSWVNVDSLPNTEPGISLV